MTRTWLQPGDSWRQLEQQRPELAFRQSQQRHPRQPQLECRPSPREHILSLARQLLFTDSSSVHQEMSRSLPRAGSKGLAEYTNGAGCIVADLPAKFARSFLSRRWTWSHNLEHPCENAEGALRWLRHQCTQVRPAMHVSEKPLIVAPRVLLRSPVFSVMSPRRIWRLREGAGKPADQGRISSSAPSAPPSGSPKTRFVSPIRWGRYPS